MFLGGELLVGTKDFEWVIRSLQPLATLLQGQLDSKKLPVSTVIVLLHQGQSLSEERTWIECRWINLPL